MEVYPPIESCEGCGTTWRWSFTWPMMMVEGDELSLTCNECGHKHEYRIGAGGPEATVLHNLPCAHCGLRVKSVDYLCHICRPMLVP